MMRTDWVFAGLAAGALVLGTLGCRADGEGSGGGAGGGGTGGTVGGGTVGGGGPIGNFRCVAGAPAGSVASATEAGFLCSLTDPLNPLIETCAVTDIANAADGNLSSFATVQYVLGALDPALGGSMTVNVGLPATFGPGQPAAFLIDFPGGEIVNASILRSLTLTTLLNGTVQETFALDNTLELDILGLLGPSDPALVGGFATQPYNALALTVDAALLTADALDAVRIYDACLAVAPL